MGDAPLRAQAERIQGATAAGFTEEALSAAAGGLDVAHALDDIAAAGFVPDTWDQHGAVPDFAGLRAFAGQATVGFLKAEA